MRNFSSKHLFPNILSVLIPFYLSFSLHHLTIPIAGDSATPYTAPENIALNCGFLGNKTAQDGRIWTGDINSTFSPIEQRNNGSVNFTAAAQQSTSVNEIPYFTARLSRSEFTYIFPVTAGQKFIRLYFYPASYQHFNRSNAFFSVKAGGYTLLNNFSASLTVDALRSEESIYKEFCVNVNEDQRLNITFTPSPTQANAYAFINGIEIVSMPTNLYYSPANNERIINLIGQNTPFPIENKTALEMVYRLNVGGRLINPMDDSGMFRLWSDKDVEYLTEAGSSVLPVSTTIQLSHTKILPYTAPDDVYRTARTMGMNKTINKSYNLTWEFPVDSGFIYLVRLHFCEFQKEVTKKTDREFHIFIANQTAEAEADVIAWSGGNGVPIYRDYAVMMQNKGSEKKQNISIALHPNSDSSTRRTDAILNGIELFKLSNSEGKISPDPILTQLQLHIRPRRPVNNR